MCTAISYKTKAHYFGRTLDYGFSYGEEVTITPRGFKFKFQNDAAADNHYAMIGTAYVVDSYPLYYDAVNEAGLCAAGLNFVGNAFYGEAVPDRANIAQYDLIPWILSGCRTVKDARELLSHTVITDEPFSENLPAAKLHWLIADRDESIVLEAMREGMRIYDNPVGVLTNNPPFDMQLFSLNNYINLSSGTPRNTFSEGMTLDEYSRGMGALGLPGDLSSNSRFVRASFVKMNAVSNSDELSSVNQFFHILGSVEQPRGCCRLDNGEYEITLFTTCTNSERGIYYYTTYENHQITAVDMNREKLDGAELIRYPMRVGERIAYEN